MLIDFYIGVSLLKQRGVRIGQGSLHILRFICIICLVFVCFEKTHPSFIHTAKFASD